MNKYCICYSLDSKYTEQVCASVASVLTNSLAEESFKFFILDGGLNADDKAKIDSLQQIKKFDIEYINMKNEDFSSCPMLVQTNENYSDYHVTIPTYYRFLLPDILENIDKILYLDCDVIVRASLGDLFNEKINKYAVAMVLDAESKKEAKRLGIDRYCNAGVMLINLEYWRTHNVKNKLFDYAKDNYNKILWQDQDIINAVLSENIKEISDTWNYQYFQYEAVNNQKTASAKILHLAGRFKPWLMPFENEIYDEYYKYLNLTPFKYKITEYRLNSSGKRLKNNIGGSVTNIVLNSTDEDLAKCWQEITKSYDFTNNQINALSDKTFSYINNQINALSDKTFSYINNQINALWKEISKPYDFIQEKVDEIRKEIKQCYDFTVEKEEQLRKEITQCYDFTNGKIDELSVNIAKETDLKFSEAYSYINAHISNLYKQVNSSALTLENNLKSKIEEINNINCEINQKTEGIKAEISQLSKISDVNHFLVNLKQLISEKDEKYSTALNLLKKDFDEKLNMQRIKYEQKLIDMENKIEEISSITEKLIKKGKNKK